MGILASHNKCISLSLSIIQGISEGRRYIENKLLDFTMVLWILVMEFELANAPITFHRLMNDLSRYYLVYFVIVYCDIILLYLKI